MKTIAISLTAVAVLNVWILGFHVSITKNDAMVQYIISYIMT